MIKLFRIQFLYFVWALLKFFFISFVIDALFVLNPVENFDYCRSRAFFSLEPLDTTSMNTIYPELLDLDWFHTWCFCWFSWLPDFHPQADLHNFLDLHDLLANLLSVFDHCVFHFSHLNLFYCDERYLFFANILVLNQSNILLILLFSF